LEAAGKPLPQVFLIRGFRLEGVVIDAMHCVDLGITLHILGNIFWEVVCSKRLASTQAASTAVLWESIKQWYRKEHVPSRRSDLTPEDLKRSTKPPKLVSKAANARHLVPYAVKLCEKYCGPEASDHDKYRLECVRALSKFYDLLDSQLVSITPESEKDIQRLGRRVTTFYALLSQEAEDKRINAWRLTPKLHLFVHLCEHQAPLWGNPAWFWCYADEDMAGP